MIAAAVLSVNGMAASLIPASRGSLMLEEEGNLHVETNEGLIRKSE